MRLKDYTNKCLSRVLRFEAQWKRDNEKMGKMFPLELSETEWEEAEQLSRDNE